MVEVLPVSVSDDELASESHFHYLLIVHETHITMLAIVQGAHNCCFVGDLNQSFGTGINSHDTVSGPYRDRVCSRGKQDSAGCQHKILALRAGSKLCTGSDQTLAQYLRIRMLRYEI